MGPVSDCGSIHAQIAKNFGIILEIGYNQTQSVNMPMSGEVFSRGPQPATRFASPPDSWPTYPSRESDPLSNLGLYLYLTFEDPSEGEWWPLDDEAAMPGRLGTRISPSRRRFQRTGR